MRADEGWLDLDVAPGTNRALDITGKSLSSSVELSSLFVSLAIHAKMQALVGDAVTDDDCIYSLARFPVAKLSYDCCGTLTRVGRRHEVAWRPLEQCPTRERTMVRTWPFRHSAARRLL